MQIKVYLFKTEHGYFSRLFTGFTKQKPEAYVLESELESVKAKLENMEIKYTAIESKTIKLEPCNVGDLRFNFDDTYGHVSKEGFIIHRTTKYVYTAQSNESGMPYFGSVQKHKVSDQGTRDFKTGKGYKI